MKKIVIFVVIALIGAGAYYYISRAPGAGAGAQQGGQAPTSVTVMELRAQKITLSQTLPGRISPYRQAQVRPQVDGVITQRFFEEGSSVAQGDRLYQIADARYNAALASAEADLAGAKANAASVVARAERYRKLVKLNAVSKQEFDDATAEKNRATSAVAVAAAALKSAQVNVDYTKVYAPISGRIGRSLVTEGALATANQTQPLAVITQLDPVYVDIQQSGAEAVRLRKKLREKKSVPVTLMLGKEEYPVKGELKFSETTVEESTGAVTMRALFANSDEILLPGLFVKAEIITGEETALIVPQRAATRSPDGGLTVWTLDKENIAHPRQFIAADAYKDGWLVKSGLTEGDIIVMEGYQKLKDGAKTAPAPYNTKVAK